MSNTQVFPSGNHQDIPDHLDGIIHRLETVNYPMNGFRGCKNEREFDRYQGAQDVIAMLKMWQKALASQS